MPAAFALIHTHTTSPFDCIRLIYMTIRRCAGQYLKMHPVCQRWLTSKASAAPTNTMWYCAGHGWHYTQPKADLQYRPSCTPHDNVILVNSATCCCAGRCSNRTLCAEGDSYTEPYICTHSLLVAHAAAVVKMRAAAPHAKISINWSVTWALPSTETDAVSTCCLVCMTCMTRFQDPGWHVEHALGCSSNARDASSLYLKRFW